MKEVEEEEMRERMESLENELALAKEQALQAKNSQVFTTEMMRQGYIKTAEDGTLLPVGEDERKNFMQIQPSPKKH